MSTHTHSSFLRRSSVLHCWTAFNNRHRWRYETCFLWTSHRKNEYVRVPHSWLKALLFTGFVSSCCRSAVWLPALTFDWLSEASHEILNQTCHRCWSREAAPAKAPRITRPDLSPSPTSVRNFSPFDTGSDAWYCASISFEAVSSLLWVTTWNVKKKQSCFDPYLPFILLPY